MSISSLACTKLASALCQHYCICWRRQNDRIIFSINEYESRPEPKSYCEPKIQAVKSLSAMNRDLKRAIFSTLAFFVLPKINLLFKTFPQILWHLVLTSVWVSPLAKLNLIKLNKLKYFQNYDKTWGFNCD